MQSPKFLFLSLLVVFALAGIAAPEEEAPPPRLFSGGVNVGLTQSFLDISTDRQCESCRKESVDYETEGVNLYQVTGNLAMRDGSVLEFKYEQPFEESDTQDELLSAGKSKETSYEKFTSGLITDPLVERYLGGESLSSKIFKKVLSLKYTYTREQFFGKAKATSNVVFLPMNTLIDYTNNVIVNGRSITAGEELTFKTVYTDRELTMALFAKDIPTFSLSRSALRLGYFWANWKRLSDTDLNSLSSDTVVYEAEFKSEGIMLAFETTDSNAPGLNINATVKVGTENSFKSAIDWKRATNTDADLDMIMGKFSLWYNHYFNRKTRDGWSLTAGGTVDIRETTVKAGESAFGISMPVSQNTDTIFKYFLSTGYRF